MKKNILHSGCYNCSYFYRSLHKQHEIINRDPR